MLGISDKLMGELARTPYAEQKSSFLIHLLALASKATSVYDCELVKQQRRPVPVLQQMQKRDVPA